MIILPFDNGGHAKYHPLSRRAATRAVWSTLEPLRPPPRSGAHRSRSRTMTQDTDTGGLQSRAEARLAALKDEKLVTRIAVLSTSLGQGKTTERLMIDMSIETHKTSPDFDQAKCDQAKSRIMQALGDIDCDVFIGTDR